MAIVVVTWNINSGMLLRNGQVSTPAQRVREIADIAVQSNAALVCLQEVPGAAMMVGRQAPPGPSPPLQRAPDANSEIARELGGLSGFQNGSWRALGVRWELAPNTPRVTDRDTGGYLFLINTGTATIAGPADYVQPESFRDGNNAYMRPPVGLPLTFGGGPLRVLTQHAEADSAHASASLQIFSNVLQGAGVRTVVCADLNVRDVGSQFRNWNDAVAIINGQRQGLDHVLCNGPLRVGTLNRQLNFTSDAQHFPIAADCF